MKSSQMIGLILWRLGVAVVGADIVFEIARRVLRYWDLPRQLEIGLGLVIAGGFLVMAALIAERIQDAKQEGSLRDQI